MKATGTINVILDPKAPTQSKPAIANFQVETLVWLSELKPARNPARKKNCPAEIAAL